MVNHNFSYSRRLHELILGIFVVGKIYIVKDLRCGKIVNFEFQRFRYAFLLGFLDIAEKIS